MGRFAPCAGCTGFATGAGLGAGLGAGAGAGAGTGSGAGAGASGGACRSARSFQPQTSEPRRLVRPAAAAEVRAPRHLHGLRDVRGVPYLLAPETLDLGHASSSSTSSGSKSPS